MENTHFIDKEPNKYEALTELHKQQIRSMNEEQATRVLERLEYAWDLREKSFLSSQNLGYNQFIDRSYFNEDGSISINDIDLGAIKAIKKRQVDFAVDLRNHVNKLDKAKEKEKGEEDKRETDDSTH
jgi:hypothetical protein